MTLEERRQIAEAMTQCVSHQTSRLLAESNGETCEEALVVTKHLIASQLEILSLLLARGASKAQQADCAPDITLRSLEALRGAARLLAEQSALASEGFDAKTGVRPRRPEPSLSNSVGK